MTVKNPYEPPTYGVRNLAIERRMAGKPPASVADEADEEDLEVKESPAPANKAARAPTSKAKAK